jgi:large repetitive protein
MWYGLRVNTASAIYISALVGLLPSGCDRRPIDELTPTQDSAVPPLIDAAQERDQSIVGYWNFDEGKGTTVSDVSGNNNHGTVRQGSTTNAPLSRSPIWGPGIRGTALRIDPAQSDWVLVPDSPTFRPTGHIGALTVMAWIRLDRFNQLARPLSSVVARNAADPRLTQFALGVQNGRSIAAMGERFATNETTIPLGEWVHLAMTYDLSLRVYVNGELVVVEENVVPPPDDRTPITFGAHINALGGQTDVIAHIDGFIDEVRIFSRALTSAEIVSRSRMVAP